MINQKPVFDLNSLESISKMARGDRSFVLQLLGTFAEQAEVLIGDVARAAAMSDLETFMRAVHTLGGSSRTMGFLRLADVCSRAEYAVKVTRPKRFDLLVAPITAEFRLARDEARHLLQPLFASNPRPSVAPHASFA